MATQDIIQSFKQGGELNCVAVAVIKAAVEIFGMNGVFRSIERSAAETTVTMLDGLSVTVTTDEITLASSSSGFACGSGRSLFEFAQLAFAVMAKRAQRAHNEGAVTFQEGITSLNDGDNFARGPEWLGLIRYVQQLKRKEIFRYAGVIGASDTHCYLASFGYEDKFGQAAKITTFSMWFNGAKYKNFMRICPQMCA